MKTRQHVNMSDVIVKSRNSEVQELQSDIIDCVLHSVVTYTMTISKLDKIASRSLTLDAVDTSHYLCSA